MACSFDACTAQLEKHKHDIHACRPQLEKHEHNIQVVQQERATIQQQQSKSHTVVAKLMAKLCPKDLMDAQLFDGDNSSVKEISTPCDFLLYADLFVSAEHATKPIMELYYLICTTIMNAWMMIILILSGRYMRRITSSGLR